jgi:hypothetical protein
VSRLSQADIIALCNAIMPIATSYKSDRDYLEVINLLCEIVKQVPSMKENVGSALYPTTQDKISIYLIQASKVFGREELGKERALSLYAKVIESFTFMIQRVPKDTAVSQTYDSFGSIAKVNGGNDKTVVQMYSGRILNALVGLRTSLQSAQIENLIDCIINLLIEPENLLGNKIVLIEELSGLSDVMPDKFAEKAIRALLPLGNGEITESTISMPYSEAQDPMNPYKMNDTSPYDLQGMAIYCLSKISKNHPALLNIEINHVLAECLASINENVRMFAYAAVSRIPSQSEELLSCLIVGTRDGNEKAASSAMGAIIGKNALELSDINWKLLALSLSLHAYSDSPQLRRLSAALIAKNMSKFPSIIELQVKELREILEVDPCYSVRYALHHPEAYLEVFK